MTRDEIVTARTADWSASEREALTAVVEALRPSPRHLVDVLDWLDDIAVRDGVRPAAVLGDAGLRAAIAARGSAPDRLKRWKERLRRLRYPRLASREAEFAAAVRALDLGTGIAIAPPTEFEGAAVTVSIQSRSAAELDAAVQRLDICRRNGALAKLFDLLE